MSCIIIGNGPSLNQISLDWLQRHKTFGTNRIYLLEGFTPSYYVCVNPLVIEQSLDEIRAMECVKFIVKEWAGEVPGSIPIFRGPGSRPHFSLDPIHSYYEGWTVTFVCMQLAYYMSFRRIGLVGVDHRYDCKAPPDTELTADAPDINHFRADYFGPGTKWNAPDLHKSEEAYKLAKIACERSGRRIVNLTPGSALDVFERGDWRTW